MPSGLEDYVWIFLDSDGPRCVATFGFCFKDDIYKIHVFRNAENRDDNGRMSNCNWGWTCAEIAAWLNMKVWIWTGNYFGGFKVKFENSLGIVM